MAKYEQIIHRESVDTTTGEIMEFETQKIFTKKITAEKFYITFIEHVASLFNLKSDSAKNVLCWLCSNAEFNTGKIMLTTNMRRKLCDDLIISPNTLTNNLKKLKDLNLISGEKGDFIINPKIFWKGDMQTREKLLKESKIQIIFNIDGIPT